MIPHWRHIGHWKMLCSEWQRNLRLKGVYPKPCEVLNVLLRRMISFLQAWESDSYQCSTAKTSRRLPKVLTELVMSR